MTPIIVPAGHQNASPPEGFRTFKCATPGCRRLATTQVHEPLIKHLSNDTRCYCEAHAAGLEVVVDSPARPESPAWPNGAKFPLYRRRQDAFGGWRGWEYGVCVLEMEQV